MPFGFWMKDLLPKLTNRWDGISWMLPSPIWFKIRVLVLVAASYLYLPVLLMKIHNKWSFVLVPVLVEQHLCWGEFQVFVQASLVVCSLLVSKTLRWLIALLIVHLESDNSDNFMSQNLTFISFSAFFLLVTARVFFYSYTLRLFLCESTL